MIRYSFSTELGYVTLYSEDNKIIKITLKSDERYNDKANEAILLAEKEIKMYLSGETQEFTFPIEVNGSQFRKKVLMAMKEIPYGHTWSYSKLAWESGYKNASRAVGTVCKNNPLPLIIPCHRVIKNNGEIGNFYGGTELKRTLLEIEK
ncbi:MAG: MGMT family protein [Candidatus Izemoplasmatales bacterium]|nr:MGMT family protein [Candidatus Izemoplasmatales bacterium]